MMKKRGPGRPKATTTQTKNKGGRPRTRKDNVVGSQFVSVEAMVAQLSLQYAASMTRIAGLENTVMMMTQSLNTCQKTIIDMQRERARERSVTMTRVPTPPIPAPTPPIREMFDGSTQQDLLDSTQ